jgi:hypothetical protein
MRKLMVVTALVLFAGIASGQTLQKGGTVAIHENTITLDPDVPMNQYMDFVINKYIPELNKAFEGVTFFMLKGDRGEHEKWFTMLVYCESINVRNKCWPGEGNTNDEFSAVMEKIRPLKDELRKWGTFKSVYTEWMML